MANAAASATQFAGQALIRTASAVAINQATSYISRVFDTRNFEGPRLESFHLQTSRDGAPMARVFGRVRLAGQVIWASHVRESSVETPVGGKGGGPTQTDYSYSISFAVGLCEGEISGVERIWANGTVLQSNGLDMRVYRGTEDQMPDPIITATEGAEAPAFRGTAYLVFEDFPLAEYGNRLPQLNIEVVRSGARVGRLENLVQSVNLLPGSGEFAYATEVVEEGVRPGETRPLNMNNLSGQADIELALDQLQAQLPNCKNISLISAWFATSTDIATCQIRPAIERRVRNIRNATWQVGRDDRNSAYVISADDEGRPNFGGTPSDESLIQAIRSIKERGMSVTLYPFILVDDEGFPWRGRMTGLAADVDGFFGDAEPADFRIGGGAEHYRASDNGFRNFILSHANLARRAGGVDRFVIGSEMVGLTTIRNAENEFPAVTELARLSEDVRQFLGANTGLTYAADWSEYFGYHPQDGSGDVFFHLDELWSHSAITAIGIDAYFPLSDWRDGDHVDGQETDSLYDLDYLSSNVEGGEGYDWYYASLSDRNDQIRTPISDWRYRYKDIRNWWLNEHRNRVGGVEQIPTDWVPQSKAFWFTEVGCPAVGYGSNQPNVFSDDKSLESNISYYSNGYRDDLIQRNYLESLISYWADFSTNPVSAVTGKRMIDLSATSVWAWDARPFPDFPSRDDVWSDGVNWQTGHWINGRVGAVDLRDVIEEICAETGLNNPDVSKVTGLVSGFLIGRPMRARDALSALIETYDLAVSEWGGQVQFSSLSSLPVETIPLERILEGEGDAIQYSIDDDMASLRDVRLTYIDTSRDYQMATISARNLQAETVRIAEFQAPIVMDVAQAQNVVERLLSRSEPARRSVALSLPVQDAPSVGAVVKLGTADDLWQVDRVTLGEDAKLSLSALPAVQGHPIVSGAEIDSVRTPAWVSEPVAIAVDLPGHTGVQVGTLLYPFQSSELSIQEQSVSVTVPMKIGALLTPLPYQTPNLWDRVSEVDISMSEGTWFSVSEAETLSGANRFAIETEKGWEIVAAAYVALIADNTYRLHTLLRGLMNSDDYMMAAVPAGARVIALDQGVQNIPLDEDFEGSNLLVGVTASGREGVSAEVTYGAAELSPLSLAHISSKADGAETELNWIPRNLDNSEAVDTNSKVEIRWPDGVKTVVGTSANIPVMPAQDTVVTLSPVDSNGRFGPPQTIIV